MTDNVGREKLKSYADRIIRLVEEAEALQSDIAEVRSEAKSDGYNLKALNAAIRRVRMSSDEREKDDQYQMELSLYVESIEGAVE